MPAKTRSSGAGPGDEAARAVRPCSRCGNLDSQDPCAICADPHRDGSVICVVEGVSDLWALERASVHQGLYHVLGGTLSALGGIGPEDLNVTPLLARIREGSFGECSHCGKEINAKRLEAVPWTRHCIECQEKLEQGLLEETPQ